MIEREYEEVLQCVAHPVDFPKRKLCDGIADCPDKSDEFACGKFRLNIVSKILTGALSSF